MKPFESFLAPQLEQYVAYRKSLGYAKQNLTPSLLALDRYVKEKGVQEQLLPPSFFLQFRAELKKRPNTVNTILSGVRSFFQFLVRQGIYKENPLKDVPPLPKTYFIPFIFSPEQVDQLLSAACRRIRRDEQHFLTDLAQYLAIVLLARCGMRIKEPLRLLRTHYRPDERTLYIEKTKFRKDRLIPIPKTAWMELENYLAVRSAFRRKDQNPSLLAGPKQGGLHAQRISRAFYRAVQDMGLERPRQVMGDMTFGPPTPHCLRHSFAINTLKRIREAGKDPQHALPVLAAYMGHRKYQYTGAYLKVLDADHLQGLIDFAKSQLDRI